MVGGFTLSCLLFWLLLACSTVMVNSSSLMINQGLNELRDHENQQNNRKFDSQFG